MGQLLEFFGLGLGVFLIVSGSCSGTVWERAEFECKIAPEDLYSSTSGTNQIALFGLSVG